MERRSGFLKLTFAAFLIVIALLPTQNELPSTASAAELEEKTPNIILLLADDLGYGDPGFMGHPSSYSPNLDKLASAGRVFTDFYVASAVCSPSRAAILTGKYPVSTGIWPSVLFPDHLGGLDPIEHRTIAKALKEDAGYATAHVGKW